jgi:uncharacterized protein YgbK (DUF1537 family)
MIADDLTGACDSGVQFAQNGFKTVVLRGNEWGKDPAAELIVVSTDSRNDAPHVARQKVMDACGRMKKQGVHVIYKKIDSTLRGNEGAEIEAVLDACGFSEAVVTPAFPEMGRVVVRGRLKTPGGVSALGVPALNVRAHLSCSKPLDVVDAATPEDLDAATEKALARSPAPLLAGSAGLASHLAAALAYRMDRTPAAPQPRKTAKPVLFLIGSDQPPTSAQVSYIVGHGLADVVSLERFDIAALDQARGERKHLVLRPAVHQAPGLILLQRLTFLRPELLGAIVICGGDTAEAVCSVLQVAAIELVCELQRGIPWGFLSGGLVGGTRIVTKAGGFSQPDSLASIAAALTHWRTRNAA